MWAKHSLAAVQDSINFYFGSLLHIINRNILQEKLLKLDFEGQEPNNRVAEKLQKLCSTDKVEFTSLSDEE